LVEKFIETSTLLPLTAATLKETEFAATQVATSVLDDVINTNEDCRR